MMYISCFGLNIPIVENIVASGQNPAWYLNVDSLSISAHDAYGKGVYSGNWSNSYNDETHYYDSMPPTTVCSAGSVDMHDGWKVRTRGPSWSSGVHITFDWYVNGPTTTARNGTLPVSFGQAGSSQHMRSIETRLFAYSVEYPNAPDEAQQRKSYYIQSVYQAKQDGIIQGEYFNPGLPLEIPVARINKEYEADCFVIEEEAPFDPSEPEPYAPSDDDSSDPIVLPDDPDIGITSAGFINVYNPSSGSLTGLGDILFPNVATATDVLEAILKLCMVISNQNLINYVIDCHVIPVAPVVGSNANIRVGYVDTAISVPRVTSDYVSVTCGSIAIPERFGGFQDYGDYTRAKIYLPFLGFVDTKPEFFQGGTLSIDYKFNVIDGSFMAYIRSTSSKSQLSASVIAQYSGVACMHFPLTGVNYSNMVSGIVGGMVSVATSKTSTAALGAAYSAANSVSSSPSVQQSNGYNSTAALLGVRTPYLMIERPSLAYPTGYKHDKGYPTSITTSLSLVSGFTVVDDIDLSGIPLTQGELDEIRSLLKEGVYF